MDLYISNEKVSEFQLEPRHTVAQMKQFIRIWVQQQGIVSYTFKLVFSDGEALAPVVIQTATYDGMDFQSKANLLKGGYIQVVQVPPQVPPQAQPEIEPEVEYERGPVGFVYTDQKGQIMRDLPTKLSTLREVRPGEQPNFILDFTTVNVDETRPFEAFGIYKDGQTTAVEVLQDGPEFVPEWIDNMFDDIERELRQNGYDAVSVMLTKPDGTHSEPGSTDIVRVRASPRNFGLDTIVKYNPNTAVFFSTIDGKQHYNVVRATINPL